jgi:hypothetical protein
MDREISPMTRETGQHLVAAEAAIQKAKTVLGRYEYQGTLRTYVTLGFISQLLEHHDAALLLIKHEMLGTAFSLTRGAVEGMFRALWLDNCATDQQVEEFTRTDKFPVSKAADVATAVDKGFQTNGYFERLHKRAWNVLNSLAHTGRVQLTHRFTGSLTKPSYSDEQIIRATHAMNTCTLILVSKFLAARDHPDDSGEVENLLTVL